MEANVTGCTVNRELSWLAFNRRVLEEAALATRPPLDRLSFLGIFLNNLDEFFRVRVGTLLDDSLRVPAVPVDDKTGWTPAQQIQQIIQTVGVEMEQAESTAADLSRAFEKNGISFLSPDLLDGGRAAAMSRYFKEEIKPLLSPIVIDAHHPFPFLRDRESAILSRFPHHCLGIIPLGRLPRFRLFSDAAGYWLLQTDAVVRFFAKKLYGKREPEETVICRVTRNADLTVEEHEGEGDFRDTMRGFVRERKRLSPVRIQFSEKPSPELLRDFEERLDAPAEVCVQVQQLPLDPSYAFGLAKALPQEVSAQLSSANEKPARVAWAQGNIADRIRERDRLLHFPFEKISPFVHLLEQASEDPAVTSIRITLYRLATNSRIALALARAAENGKDVLCVLELRARFDEENNINYSEMLQDAGCTVVYGLPNDKVHAKVCLILYDDGGEPKTITQIGTGNYNEKTAALYTDLSLLTADPVIGRDAARLFRNLCIGEPETRTDRLWVAPLSFLANVLKELDHEIAEVKAGRPGYAFLKVNGLNNMTLIRKLIEASCAGVEIDLNVRGICCIRPGIPGKTENIRITSIVGTYLEHTRLLCFGAAGKERFFIGSGDFLNRNLNRRVEVYTPVTDPDCRADLLEMVRILRQDTAKARRMKPDGSYALPDVVGEPLDSQQIFQAHYQSLNRVAPPKKSFWRRLFSR